MTAESHDEHVFTETPVEVCPGVYRLRRFRDRADGTELQEGGARFRPPRTTRLGFDLMTPRERVEFCKARGTVVENDWDRHTVDTRRELMPPPTQHLFRWFAIALLILVVVFGLGVVYWVPMRGPK